MNIYKHDVMTTLGCSEKEARRIIDHIDPAVDLSGADERQFFEAIMHARRLVNSEAIYQHSTVFKE
jgi:alkylhydroperoxidase/carboxymuconolactone decarboxylase family protein YurZ